MIGAGLPHTIVRFRLLIGVVLAGTGLACAGGSRGTTVVNRGPSAAGPHEEANLHHNDERRSQTWEQRIVERNFIEGSILQMRGLYPEAIARYRIALQFAPRNSTIHFAIAKAYRLSGRSDSAVFHSELGVRIDSTNADAVEMLAELLRERGYPAASAAQYEALVRLDVDRLQARFELARMIESEDPSRAIHHLRYLAARLPDDDVVAFALADLQRNAKDTVGAVVTLVRLIDANPDDIDVSQAVVLYMLELGHMERMLPVAKRLSRSGQRSRADESLMDIVSATLQIGLERNDVGVRDWGRDLVGLLRDREWGDRSQMLAVAQLALMTDDSTNADALVARAIDSDAGDERVTSLLRSYVEQRRYKRAEALLQIAARSPGARSETYILLGIVERETGRLRDAERHFRRATAITQSASAYEELGWIRYLRGDFDGALRYIQRSLDLGGPNGRLCERLGLTYEARGEREKALDAYRLSLDLAPDNPHLRERIGTQPFDADVPSHSSTSSLEADEQQNRNSGPTP